jgi:hypothetical protein
VAAGVPSYKGFRYPWRSSVTVCGRAEQTGGGMAADRADQGPTGWVARRGNSGDCKPLPPSVSPIHPHPGRSARPCRVASPQFVPFSGAWGAGTSRGVSNVLESDQH